ncbi:MAG TPA: alpha/beta hydrolase [Steroidobacteraceae bacterium]|nr:alpha/beta hydrolase [Steroidobacteraceae bacterium]
MKRKIDFDRQGLTLVGNLFTPENFNENGHYNAVIVEGSFTSVKEQMAGTYAQKFADQGFLALAFDYGHYGESAGEPRQLESPAEKLRDLRAAVSYLTGLPYVQAVGMVGLCTSAGNAVYLAAIEPRIKALATIAAFLPGPALFSKMYGVEGVARRKKAAADSRRKYEETGKVDFVPAYSEVDQSAVNYGSAGSYDYYLNKARGNVPEYRNESALMGLEQFLEFDPLSKASAIPTPTMVVHSDGCAFPDEAKKLYSEVQGKKELVWADGMHYDYYDSQGQIDNAVANVTRFFRTHLAEAPAT